MIRTLVFAASVATAPLTAAADDEPPIATTAAGSAAPPAAEAAPPLPTQAPIYPEMAGPLLKDRKPHGEMSVAVGTGGYRALSGIIAAPLGENGTVVLAVSMAESARGGSGGRRIDTLRREPRR